MKSYILHGEEFEIIYYSDYMEVTIPEKHRKSKNTILVFEIDGNVLDIEDKEPAEFKNLISVEHLNEPAEKFSGNGAKSLTNKIEGTADNLYGDWLGYEGEDFEAVMDLSISKSISNLTMGCMQNQNQWIFLPKEVEVFVSDNGEDFTKIASIKIETERAPEQSRKEMKLEFESIKTRYVKVIAHNIVNCPEWHKGSGGKAWLFIDELEIK